jgi:hypothetical protein
MEIVIALICETCMTSIALALRDLWLEAFYREASSFSKTSDTKSAACLITHLNDGVISMRFLLCRFLTYAGAL